MPAFSFKEDSNSRKWKSVKPERKMSKFQTDSTFSCIHVSNKKTNLITCVLRLFRRFWNAPLTPHAAVCQVQVGYKRMFIQLKKKVVTCAEVVTLSGKLSLTSFHTLFECVSAVDLKLCLCFSVHCVFLYALGCPHHYFEL